MSLELAVDGMARLTFSVLGQNVEIRCDDRHSLSLLEAAYGNWLTDGSPAAVRFRVERSIAASSGAAARRVTWSGGVGFQAEDDGDFLAELEAAVTIELQKLRSDLYFVHSAVLEKDGAAIMLAGQPGSGKSSTCWALLHRGFRYLSDELGPVDLGSLRVLPYSRALVLKEDPATSFRLPADVLRTSRAIYVPVESLPSSAVPRPVPLETIVFLDYQGSGREATLERMGAARAGAHLYTHVLNALAHTGEGLDPALEIAGRVSCFELESSSLEDSCSLIAAELVRPASGDAGR